MQLLSSGTPSPKFQIDLITERHFQMWDSLKTEKIQTWVFVWGTDLEGLLSERPAFEISHLCNIPDTHKKRTTVYVLVRISVSVDPSIDVT